MTPTYQPTDFDSVAARIDDDTPDAAQPAAPELAMNAEATLAAYAQLLAAHQRARDELLAPIREQLATVDAEFAPLIEAARKTVADHVLAHGESLKAGGLHAIVVTGRVTWDAKALDGYAAAHPEVRQFRRQGPPTVQIREEKR